MKIFAILGMSLLAAGVGACNPTYASDADMIRREIIVDRISESAEVLMPGRTFCLASSDNFKFEAGAAPDLHYPRVKLQDPPADFMSKMRQERFPNSASVLPVSQCDGWLNSKARENGARLLLINNITLSDANHATAEAEMVSVRHASHMRFKLEREEAHWKIVFHDITIE